jgi:hypothetical protein
MPNLVRQPQEPAVAGSPGAARPAPAPGLPSWRREIKFVFAGADAGQLEAVLAGNTRRQQYGTSRVSRVHSIYFDDASLTACHDSMAGIAPRRKIRLRWYDVPLATDGLFLEIKDRRNDLVSKDRTWIPLDRPLVEMRYDELVSTVISRAGEPQATLLRGSDQPVVMVSYHREHFVDLVHGIRITLDYRVAARDQTGCKGPSLGPAIALEDWIIVEVKGSCLEPETVRGLLAPLRPRLSRCSKYVLGCRCLGWLDAGDFTDPG